MKINLGCGQNKKTGFINVDKYSDFEPDVVHDLETFPWPFESDAATEIELHHCLEHLGADTDVFLNVFAELYRISAHDCVIRISVPHPRSNGFEGDPSHVRKITPAVLSLFSMKNNREWAEKGWPNTPFANYLKVDFELTKIENVLTPFWYNKYQSGESSPAEIAFAIETFFNVVDEIKMELKVIKPCRK